MNCPTCNRSSKECRFIGNFCEFCATDMAKRQAPQNVAVEQCRLCGRVRIKGKYWDVDRDSLKAIIEYEMKMPGWNAEVVSFKDRDALVRFYYSTEKDISFEKSVHLKITHKTCDECFKKSAGYYEAVVQLRGNAARVEKEMGRIDKFMQGRNAFVTKVEKLEGGYDIYVSSKGLISEYIMQRKLKAKKSFTLYGVREGKQIYRNTYFLRL
jgi:nonsense-mediated mRNA decay protein 3